ncbi:PucR family transcriptional regulator [Streptantibioticus rubrisoli]|uniref:Helix-turn-helix domain-containing protein n=1 Tax=Streptantibioticus rubrisoli TaxID=1387313 RepID=A0ABT1P7A0_9ACTN|nr:helix-turn-helix domain-containing protein [Streptantibioticus rubrisoli]MCQ4041256.1 helix-turn-helix domain-containing protein [Streptantibioticus rubrisoli]
MAHQERERVRRELLGDPRTVEAVIAAVHERVPAYAALDDGRMAEVRAITGKALNRLLYLWAADGTLQAADLRLLRGIAAARAADGRPVQAVLRAYRVALTTITELIAARADGLVDGADIFALTRLLLTTLDTLSEVMSTAYAATAEYLASDRTRALRDLLDDLIARRHASAGAIADRAQRLEVQLPDPYCLLLAEPGGPEPFAAEATAAELLGALTPSAGAATPLATTRGPRVVLLLPAAVADEAAAALRARAWRGCAITREPSDRVAAAYRLAADALDTAPGHAHQPGRLLTDADAHVLSLLAGRATATADQIARIVLGPLTEPAQRHLLTALCAYLDTGSATAAARDLHLHPQSMRYRLRRIARLTTRDPRRPWHRLTLDIARTLTNRPALPGA